MASDVSNDIYTSMVQKRGYAYTEEDLVDEETHYNDPIDYSAGRFAGNSRIVGDASPETQSRAIDALIAAGERAGLQPRQIAYVLATARVESGFNPDAAAGSTSAYGLGQFKDRTGHEYGINDTNRNDLRTQADALVALYQDHAERARSKGQGEEYIYKYYHDGPNAKESEGKGLGIAKKDVLPYLDQYEKFVHEHQQKYGIEPLGPSTAGRIKALRQGSPDESAVQGLQQHLHDLGYKDSKGAPLTADGTFGTDTREAVKKFQRENHLRATGEADPTTQAKLQEKLHELSEQQKPHAPEQSGATPQPGTKGPHTDNSAPTLIPFSQGLSEAIRNGNVEAFLQQQGQNYADSLQRQAVQAKAENILAEQQQQQAQANRQPEPPGQTQANPQPEPPSRGGPSH